MKTAPELDFIKELNQVGLIVNDIENTVNNYWNLLGIGPHVIVTVEPTQGFCMDYRGKSSNYSFKASFCHVGEVELELIQSLQGPNIYQDFLNEHGEGAHHIQSLTNTLDEFHANVKMMSDLGYYRLMGGQYLDENGFAYINTYAALKTIWETVKMPEDISGDITAQYPAHRESACPARVRVKAINRMGLIVSQLEEVAENYQRILGIGPWEITDLSPSSLQDVVYLNTPVSCGWKLGVSAAGSSKIELIQPTNGKSLFSDLLETHGEGIHYLQFQVDDIDETTRKMIADDIPVLMEGRFPNGRFAFYDTVGPLKIIWEAIQLIG